MSARKRSHDMTDEQIKHMVSRFLAWRLPEDFAPDGGISFRRMFNEHTPWEPMGTNLLTYEQAKAMVLHMLEGLPEDPPIPTPADAAIEPDDALVERVADAMFHCAVWSSFWSKEDAKFLARAAIVAIRGEP